MINVFDEMFEYYESQLTSAFEKANDMVNQTEVTTETTLTEYIAYAAFGLSSLLSCVVLFASVSAKSFSIMNE